MTVIDKISFRFRMADEAFARALYADWDEFCRRCVLDVMDGFFSRYDNKETYIGIERLDLDLGGIPQEEFQELFPIRLREALERSFGQYLNEPGAVMERPASYTREKRFENLLHYLMYGFCLPEWERPDFDLYEELRRCLDTGYGSRLFSAIEAPHVLARLFSQLDISQLEKLLFSAADEAWDASLLSMLCSPAAAPGRQGRQRLLSMMLDAAPQRVTYFIHASRDTGRIDFMAELLQNTHVRRIMAAETEDHAEIGVPEYWYRLYGWLIAYYPFNGVPMFGDKQHFRLHLNRRLLAFIHKRDSAVYLSKVDITRLFLLEVFGADHYRTVLGILYHNQRLNADGTPESGDSYGWELYYILLQLSLLGTEDLESGHTGRQPTDEQPDETTPPTSGADRLTRDERTFGRWLEDAELPDSVKRRTLSMLIREKPGMLVRWIEGRPDRAHLSLLAALIDRASLTGLAGHLSLQLAEAVSVLYDTIGKASSEVSWLQNVGRSRFWEALKMAVLQGISAGIFSASDAASAQMLQLAALLYREITGQEIPTAYVAGFKAIESTGTSESASGEYTAMAEPIREFMETVYPVFASADNDTWKGIHRGKKLHEAIPEEPEIASLRAILSDNGIPESAGKMFVLQCFDAVRGRESELIMALQSEKLLDTAIALLDTLALRHIAMRLAIQAYGTDGQTVRTTAIQLVGLLAEQIETVAEAVSGTAKAVWKSLLLSLASWNGGIFSVSANDDTDTAVRLLAAVAGDDRNRIMAVVGLSDKGTAQRFDTGNILSDAANNALLTLLVRVRQYIVSENHTPELPAMDIRKDSRHMNAAPREAMRLLRETVARDRSTVNPWTKIIGSDSVLYLLGQSDSGLSGRLAQIIGAINTVLAESELFTGSSEEWEQSIAKALLLLMAERTDVGTMNEEETVSLFLRHLHLVLTGNGEYTDADRSQWETLERQAVRLIVTEIPAADVQPDRTAGLKAAALPFGISASGQEVEHFDRWVSWLLCPSVSDTEKSQMLRYYARWQPELLWTFVRYAAAEVSGKEHVAAARWSVWLGLGDWLEMISGVSLSLGDTLCRTTETVSEKYGVGGKALAEGLVRFITCYPADRIYYGNASDIVRRYLENVIALSGDSGMPEDIRERLTGARDENRTERKEQEEEKQEESSQSAERESSLEAVVKAVEEELHITDTERALEDAVQPEYVEVPNAGLCLLAIWFPRLFGMLGLLEDKEDGRKDLKDTEARIRAIFILQRIVTDEPREYKEQELAFNRILAGCPFYVPLPKSLTLTNQEIQTVESMISGVKSNWDKLKNTSVKGFRQSFIERPGRLEQREDKWVLYVEERAYDILLDSLPWSYRTIRLPWLKKRISVVWRDKEEFDFENYNK